MAKLLTRGFIPLLQAVLDKSARGLLKAANIAQPAFQTAMCALIHKSLTYSCLHVASVKSEARVVEKMAELGKEREMSILDMNRATILCSTEADFAHVCANIPSRFGQYVKIKNKFNGKWEKISEPPCLFFQLELKCDELCGLLEIGSFLNHKCGGCGVCFMCVLSDHVDVLCSCITGRQALGGGGSSYYSKYLFDKTNQSPFL